MARDKSITILVDSVILKKIQEEAAKEKKTVSTYLYDVCKDVFGSDQIISDPIPQPKTSDQIPSKVKPSDPIQSKAKTSDQIVSDPIPAASTESLADDENEPPRRELGIVAYLRKQKENV
jgi:hypothetical protein